MGLGGGCRCDILIPSATYDKVLNDNLKRVRVSRVLLSSPYSLSLSCINTAGVLIVSFSGRSLPEA